MRQSLLLPLAVLAGLAAALLSQAGAQLASDRAPAVPRAGAPGAGHGFLIDRHMAAGLKCTACHPEGHPAQQPDMAVCTNCHGSYGQIAAKTASDQPNPHESHLGSVACATCHHVHRASQTYCAICHTNFNMTTP